MRSRVGRKGMIFNCPHAICQFPSARLRVGQLASSTDAEKQKTGHTHRPHNEINRCGRLLRSTVSHGCFQALVHPYILLFPVHRSIGNPASIGYWRLLPNHDLTHSVAAKTPLALCSTRKWRSRQYGGRAGACFPVLQTAVARKLLAIALHDTFVIICERRRPAGTRPS